MIEKTRPWDIFIIIMRTPLVISQHLNIETGPQWRWFHEQFISKPHNFSLHRLLTFAYHDKIPYVISQEIITTQYPNGLYNGTQCKKGRDLRLLQRYIHLGPSCCVYMGYCICYWPSKDLLLNVRNVSTLCEYTDYDHIITLSPSWCENFKLLLGIDILSTEVNNTL